MTPQPISPTIPNQKYCWACDGYFATADPRQQNCDGCIARYAPKQMTPWYEREEPVAIDLEALESWEQSRATDYDVAQGD